MINKSCLFFLLELIYVFRWGNCPWTVFSNGSGWLFSACRFCGTVFRFWWKRSSFGIERFWRVWNFFVTITTVLWSWCDLVDREVEGLVLFDASRCVWTLLRVWMKSLVGPFTKVDWKVWVYFVLVAVELRSLSVMRVVRGGLSVLWVGVLSCSFRCSGFCWVVCRWSSCSGIVCRSGEKTCGPPGNPPDFKCRLTESVPEVCADCGGRCCYCCCRSWVCRCCIGKLMHLLLLKLSKIKVSVGVVESLLWKMKPDMKQIWSSGNIFETKMFRTENTTLSPLGGLTTESYRRNAQKVYINENVTCSCEDCPQWQQRGNEKKSIATEKQRQSPDHGKLLFGY